MLFRRFGTRTRIYYMHWTRTNFRAETGPPDPKWFEDLVARCPSLSWGGEVQSYGGLGLSDLSEITRLSHCPNEGPNQPNESAALKKLQHRREVDHKKRAKSDEIARLVAQRENDRVFMHPSARREHPDATDPI